MTETVSRDERAVLALMRVQDTLHDIKTPVSIVYNMAHLLERSSELSAEGRRLAGRLAEQCRYIAELLGETGLADALGAERVKPRLSRQDIVSLAEGAAISMAGLAGRKRARVTFDTNVEELDARTDRLLLERILINLLSNAVKFTDEGGEIFVTLTAERGRVLIEVLDGGVGFSEDELAAPYRRYHSGKTAMNPDGTGIGLALTHEMCQALGGSLDISNAPGGGARALVTLPIDDGDGQISLLDDGQ